MNIAEILQQQARERADTPAIIDVARGAERVATYAQIERDAQHVAGMLTGLGLDPGDRVLVFVPMSRELYTLLSGIFRAGMVAMFLDPSAGRDHIARCCQIGHPRAFVAIRKAHLLRLTSSALRKIPIAISVGGWTPFAVNWSRLEQYPRQDNIHPAEPSSDALISFTSGSTGVPKAAMRSHGFLVAQHRALARSIHLEAGQIDLGTLPIFTLANLASGLTTVIPDADLRSPGAVDPAPIVEQIQRRRITRATASPAFFERIADHCIARQTQLPTLQQVYTGGAPVFPRLLEKVRHVAPSADVVSVYGSTEAEPIAHAPWAEVSAEDRKAMVEGAGLLAGAVEPEVGLRILKRRWPEPVRSLSADELDARTCPAGVPGEIIVTGDHVLRGYLGGVGDEQTKIRVGEAIWHRTGDAGYLDPRGRLWLLGRCEGCIADGRGEIYPLTVEVAATEVEGVRRSAMIAHEGRRVLTIELEEGAGEDVVARVRDALAWAKLDAVIRLPQIPVDKRHNAKVDYPALRQAVKAAADVA